MKPIVKFCIFTPIKIFIISSLIVFVAEIIFPDWFGAFEWEDNLRPRTAYIHASDFILPYFIFSLITYTIFFNLNEKIRYSNIKSFVAFFWFEILFFVIGLPFYIITIIFRLPYLIMLVFYFIRFKIRMRRGDFGKLEITITSDETKYDLSKT